jgi:deoxyribose-phosphate aldolase
VRCGAKEIDTVINIGALKSHDYRLVFEDLKAVVEAVRGVPVKVILETSQLDTEEKIIACALSKAAGAAFVKTSTGFSKGGATVEDVALMRRIRRRRHGRQGLRRRALARRRAALRGRRRRPPRGQRLGGHRDRAEFQSAY